MDLSDTNWQTISIPHNWGWEEAQQGKDYYRGPGWYRRELDLKPQAGKRYFLRFEAASLFADVYLNGDFLGEHRGGFGAFCFEITGHLSASGTNVIAVRVSNSWEPDIAPLSGDFSVYGGLYRPVHLLETAAENFTPTDHGSPGVAWLQTSVTKKKALLDMTAQISNGTRNNQSLTLVATVLDASGKKIAETKQPVTLAANTTAPYWLRVTVPHPHLWNGRPDPYLYQAVVELRSTNGIVDSVAQPLGLRFYRVDPDKGFFLNGKPYALARRGPASRPVEQRLGDFRRGHGRRHAAHPGNRRDGRPLRALRAQRLFLQPVRQGGHSGLGGNPAGQRNQRLGAFCRNFARPVA